MKDNFNISYIKMSANNEDNHLHIVFRTLMFDSNEKFDHYGTLRHITLDGKNARLYRVYRNNPTILEFGIVYQSPDQKIERIYFSSQWCSPSKRVYLQQLYDRVESTSKDCLASLYLPYPQPLDPIVDPYLVDDLSMYQPVTPKKIYACMHGVTDHATIMEKVKQKEKELYPMHRGVPIIHIVKGDMTMSQSEIQRRVLMDILEINQKICIYEHSFFWKKPDDILIVQLKEHTDGKFFKIPLSDFFPSEIPNAIKVEVYANGDIFLSEYTTVVSPTSTMAF